MTTQSKLVPILVFFWFVAATFSTVAAEQVIVRLEVFKVRGDIGGSTSLTDNIVEGLEGRSLSAKQDPFVFFTLADLRVARTHLVANEKEWKWDGKKRPSRDGRIDLVASPMVIVNEGKSFEVSIRSSQPIEHFRKRADGLFEHRTSDERTGLTASAAIERGPGERIVLRDFSIHMKTVVERKPIEGVSLNVGEPIFNEEHLTTSLSLKSGKFYGIQAFTRREGVLLIQLIVERVSKDREGESAEE